MIKGTHVSKLLLEFSLFNIQTLSMQYQGAELLRKICLTTVMVMDIIPCPEDGVLVFTHGTRFLGQPCAPVPCATSGKSYNRRSLCDGITPSWLVCIPTLVLTSLVLWFVPLQAHKVKQLEGPLKTGRGFSVLWRQKQKQLHQGND